MVHWVYFFFSSRRRHTRLQGDWSSDVCSSDLGSAGTKLVDVRNHALAIWCSPSIRRGASRGHGPIWLKIGRASCRERVEVSVVGVAVMKRGEEERADNGVGDQVKQDSTRESEW